VRRVLFCTGKIYYDLLEGQERLQAADVAVVRVEQLYPFPEPELRPVLERYAGMQEVFWVQEEAQNMGAWSFVRWRLDALLAGGIATRYVGRDEAASPATGSYDVHQAEQREIIEQAFGDRAGGSAPDDEGVTA
jgi:2-oxoglutarate dehydrogenase complex dehydrogenase (E1) component-like enzyme